MKITEVLISHKDAPAGFKGLGSTKMLAKKLKFSDGRPVEYTIGNSTMYDRSNPKKKGLLINISFPTKEGPVRANTYGMGYNNTGYDHYHSSPVEKTAIDKETLKKVIPAVHKRIEALHPPKGDVTNDEFRDFDNKVGNVIYKCLRGYEILSKYIVKGGGRASMIDAQDELNDKDLEDYVDF